MILYNTWNFMSHDKKLTRYSQTVLWYTHNYIFTIWGDKEKEKKQIPQQNEEISTDLNPFPR